MNLDWKLEPRTCYSYISCHGWMAGFDTVEIVDHTRVKFLNCNNILGPFLSVFVILRPLMTCYEHIRTQEWVTLPWKNIIFFCDCFIVWSCEFYDHFLHEINSVLIENPTMKIQKIYIFFTILDWIQQLFFFFILLSYVIRFQYQYSTVLIYTRVFSFKYSQNLVFYKNNNKWK